MFSIYDGREKFFQWDLNRKLIVYEPSIKEVHFSNCLCERARKCETYTEGNLTLVDVPNELLQEYLDIYVYGYDGESTKHSAVFDVVKRTKPEEYVYTPEEIKTAVFRESNMGVVLNNPDYNTATGRSAISGGEKIDRSGAPDDALPEDMRYNEAIGTGSMAVGMGAVAYGRASKSFGYRTQTGYVPTEEELAKRPEAIYKTDSDGNFVETAENVGQGAFAIGSDTAAVAQSSFAGGYKTLASGLYSVALGNETQATGQGAFSMGKGSQATGSYSIAMGINSKATGSNAIAMGNSANATTGNAIAMSGKATGAGSVAIGLNAQATGSSSVAISGAQAKEKYSVAIGSGNIATGKRTFATGDMTNAIGDSAFTEGYMTKAEGSYSHAGGYQSKTGENAMGAFALGYQAVANGKRSFAAGFGTQADTDSSFVCGKYNEIDENEKYLFTVGGGSSDTNRKNLFTVDKYGTGRFDGALYANAIMADGNLAVTQDASIRGNIILYSPNGTPFIISVTDDGTLIAVDDS